MKNKPVLFTKQNDFCDVHINSLGMFPGHGLLFCTMQPDRGVDIYLGCRSVRVLFREYSHHDIFCAANIFNMCGGRNK
jgi:hypothetical protein